MLLNIGTKLWKLLNWRKDKQPALITKIENGGVCMKRYSFDIIPGIPVWNVNQESTCSKHEIWYDSSDSNTDMVQYAEFCTGEKKIEDGEKALKNETQVMYFSTPESKKMEQFSSNITSTGKCNVITPKNEDPNINIHQKLKKYGLLTSSDTIISKLHRAIKEIEAFDTNTCKINSVEDNKTYNKNKSIKYVQTNSYDFENAFKSEADFFTCKEEDTFDEKSFRSICASSDCSCSTSNVFNPISEFNVVNEDDKPKISQTTLNLHRMSSSVVSCICVKTQGSEADMESTEGSCCNISAFKKEETYKPINTAINRNHSAIIREVENMQEKIKNLNYMLKHVQSDISDIEEKVENSKRIVTSHHDSFLIGLEKKILDDFHAHAESNQTEMESVSKLIQSFEILFGDEGEEKFLVNGAAEKITFKKFQEEEDRKKKKFLSKCHRGTILEGLRQLETIQTHLIRVQHVVERIALN